MGCVTSQKTSKTPSLLITPVLYNEKKLPKPVLDGLGKLLYGKATDRVKASQNSEPKTEVTTVSTFRQKDTDPTKALSVFQASVRGVKVQPQNEQPMGSSEQGRDSQRGPLEDQQLEPDEARQGMDVGRGVEPGPDQGLEEGHSPHPEDSKAEEEVKKTAPKNEAAASGTSGTSQPVTALFEEMPSGATDVPKFSYVEEHSSIMEVAQT
jgi:hypothetical protein